MITTTFANWRIKVDRDGIKAIPRVTYVCGPEPVLVEEVVDDIWHVVNPEPWNRIRLTAGEANETEIWSLINQHSIDAGSHGIVQVRDAQLLEQWEKLELWLSASPKQNTRLIFVSSEDRPPDKTLNRGNVIHCKFTNDASAVSWVRGKAPVLDDDTANYLLNRAGGNLTTISSTCQKLLAIPMPNGMLPGRGVIDVLCVETPRDSFVESLIVLDHRAALLAAEQVGPQSLYGIIATLDSKLSLLSQLKSNLTPREQSMVPGVSPFLVNRYISVVREYSEANILRRRKVLAVIDEALHRGARIGLLESLVALW